FVAIAFDIDEISQSLVKRMQAIDKCKVQGIGLHNLAQIVHREEIIASLSKQFSPGILWIDNTECWVHANRSCRMSCKLHRKPGVDTNFKVGIGLSNLMKPSQPFYVGLSRKSLLSRHRVRSEFDLRDQLQCVG